MKKDFFSSSFLIVGLARNCEEVIHNEVKKINEAFSEAASIDWLIIESDSDDRTIQKLDSFTDDLRLRYITLGRLQQKYPRRTERIALCRNCYLEEIKSNPEYEKIDYVVVADLDGVNSKLTAASVKTCWQWDVNWDACFANQSAPYYDIWALRHDLWSPTDCFEQEAFLRRIGVNDFYNKYISVLSKMVCIPKTYKPIKVKSAFGGLGIYKKNLLLNGKYVGVDEKGNEVCEHVYFHNNFLGCANLYIIPSLINCGWNEHSRRRSNSSLIILYLATRFFSISTLKTFKDYLFKKLKR